MSILLRVERESGGQPLELGDGKITGYSYINTSPADFLAKAYNAEHSIQIRGEIPLRLLPPVGQDVDNSNTLYAWALTEYRPDNDYYRTVTVQIVRHEKTIREVKFTHAYVHVYQEQVNGLKGVLEFELVVRQRRDQFDSIQFGSFRTLQPSSGEGKHTRGPSSASKIEFWESQNQKLYASADIFSSDSSEYGLSRVEVETYINIARIEGGNGKYVDSNAWWEIRSIMGIEARKDIINVIEDNNRFRYLYDVATLNNFKKDENTIENADWATEQLVELFEKAGKVQKESETLAMGFIGPASVGTRAASLIKNETALVRAAQEMGKNPVVQKEADDLILRFLNGNTNPGIGSKNLVKDISYLRGKEGARIFYRMRDGEMQILAKANKANEDAVIRIIKKIYGKE